MDSLISFDVLYVEQKQTKKENHFILYEKMIRLLLRAVENVENSNELVRPCIHGDFEMCFFVQYLLEVVFSLTS